MARYHITASGDPGLCRAQIECPLGDSELHFETKEEARKAFEKMMTPLAAGIKHSLKTLDSDGLRQSLFAEAHEAKMNIVLIQKAAAFATSLHEGQFRAAAPGEKRPPYITHPLRNAVRVIRWGSKSTVHVLGALLHDVVEDSSEKYAKDEGLAFKDEDHARSQLLTRIRADYGDRVAELVHKLSNPVQAAEERARLSVEEKHRIYKAHVTEAISDDSDVLLLKLSDFHDNAAGLYHTDFEHRKAQTEKQARKYLATLPAFAAELERNPLPDEKIHDSAVDSVALIEARLRWMLNK